jgi:hypothetical protein
MSERGISTYRYISLVAKTIVQIAVRQTKQVRARRMSNDRRGNVRRTLRVNGFLLRGDDTPALSCTLVDISATGARLMTSDIKEVPNEFTVAFTPNGTPSRKCRVVWRGDEDIGVAFEIEKPISERPHWASREEALSAFGLHS